MTCAELQEQCEESAARLGLPPDQARGLSPAELRALWEGWWWRYSRVIDVVANAIFWLRGAWAADDDLDVIKRSFDGYRATDGDGNEG